MQYYQKKYPDFVFLCEDESTFLYDSVSRKVWAIKGSKPKRLVTGLHNRIHIFGFLLDDKKKMFLLKEKLNAKTFLEAMYQMKQKFGNVILVIDKAPWHKKSKKVQNYLKKRKDEIKIIWLPTGCPEMNPVEECWRQAKKEVNGGKIHTSFAVMKKELKHFLRCNEFKQELGRYLCP